MHDIDGFFVMDCGGSYWKLLGAKTDCLCFWLLASADGPIGDGDDSGPIVYMFIPPFEVCWWSCTMTKPRPWPSSLPN